MIQITPTTTLNEAELQFEYIRASGPGGQNVNKVATAVQLRFDIANSPSLASDTKGRLIRLSGSRVNADGVLLIEAKRFRTQEKNREDAVERLVELIQKPTRASKETRLKEKKQRGAVKKTRQNKSFDL